MPEPLPRPWRADDAAALALLFTDTSDLRLQFGGADLTAPADAAAHIRTTLSADDSQRSWALEINGVLTGNVSISRIDRQHDCAWVSYWLAAPARGKGHAVRSVISAAEWAFDRGLFRLELGHRVNNPASCAVATGAGFSTEEVERQKLRYGVERFDVELHARLANDPAPATPGLRRAER